jgi:hypothetical protein
VPELRIDPAASRLIVRTRAAGVLARLAHDVEICASQIRGGARLDGDAWTGDLAVPVSGLTVAGALRGDRLDPGGLSVADRMEIEHRLRDQVLRGTREVRVRASGSARDRADARVELAAGSAQIAASLATREAPGGALLVSGGCRLSLRALGVQEVKGPLGAFKIRDEVEVLFEITLRPAD